MTQLRAQILVKTNWLRGKIEYIREALMNAMSTSTVEEVMGLLEFKNEEESAKLKPTKSNPKEVPYIKNNPREKELNAQPGANGGENGGPSGSTVQPTL